MAKLYRAVIVLFLAAIAGNNCRAQATAAVPDPEFMNQVYYLDSANKPAALEKNSTSMVSKSKMGGFGGSSSAYVMPGKKSPIRIKSGKDISFIIKMDGMMMDPTAIISLFKFETSGYDREAVLQKTGVMGKSGAQSGKGITMNLKKTPTGSYILIPDQPLTPGEYGFINMMSPASSGTKMFYTTFAFGVD